MSDLVQLLCDLSEASNEVFRVGSLDHKSESSLHTLAKLGAVSAGPRPDSITCQACDADHFVVLEFDTQARNYIYFCREAGLVEVDEADLATLRFNAEWLVDWLVAGLPIASPVRRRAILPESIWHLGDTKCGSTLVTAVFVRRVTGQVALGQLASGLRSVHPADKGVVITTSLSAVRTIPLPNGYEFIHLSDLIVPQPDGIAMDRNRFGSWIRRMPTGGGKGAATRSGRPSQGATIAEIFRLRRARRIPIDNISAEARGIVAEWAEHAPDQEAPALGTVRAHVTLLTKAPPHGLLDIARK
jgi:hypothetical protein